MGQSLWDPVCCAHEHNYFNAGKLIVFALVVRYVTYGFAIVITILGGPQEDKTVLFVNLAGLFCKLQLLGKPDDVWFLTRRLR